MPGYCSEECKKKHQYEVTNRCNVRRYREDEEFRNRRKNDAHNRYFAEKNANSESKSDLQSLTRGIEGGAEYGE
jgi:hypothetical protein